MPFTRDGQWINPVDRDIQAFKSTLNPKDENIVTPTPQLIEALKGVAKTEGTTESRAPVDFFKTLSRIQGEVDIVIPVYGGLHVLKSCVESIKTRTHWKYNLIFVDDASNDPEIKYYLNSLDAEVLTNQRNRGFAATVNRGVGRGKSPYVCVLNSDVIVTDGWLSRMLVALESDPKNCIVNPCTNNTALVNVDMYPGRSYLDMDTALSRQSHVRYPEIMPTGFCFMYRRSLIKEIGPFDEAFGSYGEETDFWFRAIKHVTDEGYHLGYKAVLADNCYLFHERGTSFSQLGEMNHAKQRQVGSARFHKLHPDFGEWQKGFDVHDAIGSLRESIPPKAFTKEHLGNVAWAVKSAGPCGGMYYIADVANELIERGYNVKVCVVLDLEDDQEIPQQALIGNLRTRPIVFKSPREFVSTFADRVFSGKGTLFSAVTELTPACEEVSKLNKGVRVINHVQSWDVDLAEHVNRNDMIDMIKEQYRTVPNVVVSDYICQEINALGGRVLEVINPGVDPNLFHDRDRANNGDERTTFAIIMIKDNPYKGYERGVEVCKAFMALPNPENFRLLAIGADSVPEVPGVIGMGSVSQSKMADLLGREVDVLIDPSVIHSYGLPGLEAIFSGAAYVCWDNEGVYEYLDDFGQRIKVLDCDASAKDAVDAAYDLVNRQIRPFYQLDQIDNTEHFRHESVSEFIYSTISAKKKVEEHKAETDRCKIQVVTPHMRKHGGPTTLATTANMLAGLGHNVEMSMIYTDWNPEVVRTALVPLRTKNWEKVPKGTDIVIINSDNPFAKQIMDSNPDSSYIMYKLSHNERFKEIEAGNLNLDWDHIVTSTEWLRQACLNRTDGWDYRTWTPEEVTTVGWYHYSHPIFNNDPANKILGSAQTGFKLGTLIHNHPLKGSQEALAVINALKKKYEANFHASGVGEVKAKLPQYMQYFPNLNRKDLAHVMKQFDIWLGASHTEGLGRMALEAMSAGCAVVTTNTGAEFLKDGENCLLFEPGDAQRAGELCDKIANEPELMRTIITNGYKTAVEHADSSELSTNFEKVIREVMND